MTAALPATVHATAIALGQDAVLLRGASGSGKSDLALRCIALAPGALFALPALLVADDRVILACRDGALFASPPPALAGRIEVRGLGIVAVPTLAEARVRLVVDLVAAGAVERMPAEERCTIEGVALPRLDLVPFEPSAPVKLLLALRQAAEGRF